MKILIIDDEKIRHFGFSKMYPNDELFTAYNVKEAFELLDNNKDPELIHLDHDLKDFEQFNDGRKPIEHTGMEICSYLIKRGYLGKVIIHSWNTVASLKMKKMFEDNNITVSYEPFSVSTPAQES